MDKKEWLELYLDRIEELSREFFRSLQGRIEARGGLSPSQFYLLKLLSRAGSCTVSDVAQQLGVSVAGATGLIDRLVRAGMVIRRRDQADRRVVHIGLSRWGEEELAKACRNRRQIMAELMQPLTAEEAATLVGLMEKLNQAAHSSEFEGAE